MSWDSKIDLAEELFGAWSSGRADAPAPFFHPDGVPYDIIGGLEVDYHDRAAARSPGIEVKR